MRTVRGSVRSDEPASRDNSTVMKLSTALQIIASKHNLHSVAVGVGEIGLKAVLVSKEHMMQARASLR